MQNSYVPLNHSQQPMCHEERMLIPQPTPRPAVGPKVYFESFATIIVLKKQQQTQQNQQEQTNKQHTHRHTHTDTHTHTRTHTDSLSLLKIKISIINE